MTAWFESMVVACADGVHQFIPGDPICKCGALINGRERAEGRDGMVTVYDSLGQYVGCMGIELWRALIAARAALAAAAPPARCTCGKRYTCDCGSPPADQGVVSAWLDDAQGTSDRPSAATPPADGYALRCGVCEGMDAPGLMHNYDAVNCSATTPAETPWWEQGEYTPPAEEEVVAAASVLGLSREETDELVRLARSEGIRTQPVEKEGTA